MLDARGARGLHGRPVLCQPPSRSIHRIRGDEQHAIDASIRTGKLDVVSNTVEKLTGTPPKSLQAFLGENKAALTAPR